MTRPYLSWVMILVVWYSPSSILQLCFELSGVEGMRMEIIPDECTTNIPTYKNTLNSGVQGRINWCWNTSTSLPTSSLHGNQFILKQAFYCLPHSLVRFTMVKMYRYWESLLLRVGVFRWRRSLYCLALYQMSHTFIGAEYLLLRSGSRSLVLLNVPPFHPLSSIVSNCSHVFKSFQHSDKIDTIKPSAV
jgi:hypothetical protein